MGRSKRRIIWTILLASLALILAACGGEPAVPSGSGSVNAAADSEHNGDVVVVTIKNFKFEPAEITVAPGTKVVFVNQDPTPHNVVEGTREEVAKRDHDPLFESPDLAPGERWEYIFDTEGEYPYACTIAGHYLMGMLGTVNVVEGAEPAVTVATESAEADDDHASHESTADHADHAHALGPSPTIQAIAEANPDLYTLTPEGLVDLKPFRVEGNVKEFAMDIQEIEHELLDGVVVTAWAFNGTMPGPTLRVTEGDIVRVHFTNTHHQPHTIHWHGIYADQKHDGVPHTSAAVMPGETRVYEFVAERPGTFWYHCHVDSYRHVDLGMYGSLIIEPKDGKTWDREYTLMLDDWDADIDPMAAKYEPDHNYFLVNGRAFPDVPGIELPVGETTRIRLINAGYSNVAMHMHGPSFMVVDTDGRPLPYSYEKDTLDVAPGERYDIEVTPTKAGDYPFHAHNLHYVTNDGAYPGGMHLMVHIVDQASD